MKNKNLTYLLGLVVVIVWGIIIYRIIDAAKGTDDDNMIVISGKPQQEAYNDFTVPQDTSHLLLNYRDPFGLVKQKDTSEISIRRKYHKSIVTSSKPAINWSLIKYSGYIRNSGSKKTVALLSVNGRSLMLAEGESAQNIKVLKNMRDSVKVIFNGQIKYITMNPRTL